MTGAVRDIGLLLGVSEEEASAIRDRIDDLDLLDWSECTTGEFKSAARAAALDLFLEGEEFLDVSTFLSEEFGRGGATN